ncbi:MAG: hypothetical protein ACUVS3_12640 [Thermodesulfobacteriota bacterium]
MKEIKERGYDLAACNPKEGEALPLPLEIVAALLERDREIFECCRGAERTLREQRFFGIP